MGAYEGDEQGGRKSNPGDQEGDFDTASLEAPLSSGVAQTGPRWVEDLAGPDDYWLTLTDAARVTRRQEVTIRRWVAAGSLPIRNRALGINKRTRHVRASDLARLSPIVDASATISGATARIDLLSIPEQQAQLLQRQREIDQQAQSLTAQLEQVQHSARAQQTQLDQHHAQLAAVESAAEALLTELSTSRQQAEKRHSSFGRQLTALQQNVRLLGKETRQLQGEQQVLRSAQERVAERQTGQENEQREYALRVEQIEKQQRKDARDRGKLQRGIDELTQRTNLLERHLQQVVEGLSQLREDLHQEAAAAKQQTSEITQQLQVLQLHFQEVDTGLQATAGLLAQDHERLGQLIAQVSVLATPVTAPAPSSEQAGKPTRRRRLKQPSRMTTR
jgi:hypothetical protein